MKSLKVLQNKTETIKRLVKGVSVPSGNGTHGLFAVL